MAFEDLDEFLVKEFSQVGLTEQHGEFEFTNAVLPCWEEWGGACFRDVSLADMSKDQKRDYNSSYVTMRRRTDPEFRERARQANRKADAKRRAKRKPKPKKPKKVLTAEEKEARRLRHNELQRLRRARETPEKREARLAAQRKREKRWR